MDKTEQASKTPGLDSTSAAPDSGADAAASANQTADSKGTMPNIAAGNAAQDDKTGSTTHGNKTAGAAHVNKTAGAALESKLKKLESILHGYGKMTVALSGGVDSAFLLCFAYKTWHDNRIAALTACGPHFAPDETEYSAALCSTLGISHELIPVDHILPLIEDNPVDRCYVCKKAIFSSIKKLTDEQGRVLADGTNLDDMSDYRPGHKALQELKVASPLKEAGLTKQEIRAALHQLAESDPLIKQALTVPSPGGSLPMWEKPAFACLASRIPYGEQITREKLAAVYKAESYLRSLGFTQLRVRHHGNVARIEVLPEDRSRFYDEAFMDMVNEEIKKCGFKFAALDLGGYRMGSLNG